MNDVAAELADELDYSGGGALKRTRAKSQAAREVEAEEKR